jgi:AcrR family transcriptional regulator
VALRQVATPLFVSTGAISYEMATASKTRSSSLSARQRGTARRDWPAGQVLDVQRARLLAATVDAIWERGGGQATVADLIGRARVSRKTFYCLFADREDCVAAAFEQALAEARTLAREAYSGESDWREGIRAALCSLLTAMDDRPALAWLYLVEVFGAGEVVMRLRAEVVDELAQVIDCARALEHSRRPPRLTAEGVVGGVLAVLHKRVIEQSEEPLVGLLGPLMSIIVLPYLGSQAAARELRRSTPPAEGRRQQRRPVREADPLRGLDMRLTYRTMRVLMAIAEQPGASNREIAIASGIADQGQISKLMTRLERLELVENFGQGQEHGAANAWHLTTRGIELERVTGIRPLLAA